MLRRAATLRVFVFATAPHCTPHGASRRSTKDTGTVRRAPSKGLGGLGGQERGLHGLGVGQRLGQQRAPLRLGGAADLGQPPVQQQIVAMTGRGLEQRRKETMIISVKEGNRPVHLIIFVRIYYGAPSPLLPVPSSAFVFLFRFRSSTSTMGLRIDERRKGPKPWANKRIRLQASVA